MNKNPLIEIREQRGIKRREFALLLGVSYGMLTNVELGYSALPNGWSAKFEAIGVDFLPLAKANAEWLQGERLALKSAKGV